MKRALFLIALVFCMILGMATVAVAVTEGESLTLAYDDRKDLAQLLDTEIETVEITNEAVTSQKVGTDTADEHVLHYENGTLYAVGTGTATLTVNGTDYAVTVSPAKLNMFLITGHSIGYGQYGDPNQSVAIEPGQAYSTFFRTSITSAEGGLGWGADTRVGGTGTGSIDAFAAGNSGTLGVGSALAYRWNQLTGEKVWVMNLSIPGSALNEWIPGVRGWHTEYPNYQYKYESVLERYGYAQQVVKNEIAAGHYTLGHQLMIYFSGGNFQLTGYTDATAADMIRDYDLFWEGLKKDLAMDMDGDGEDETLEYMGLHPGYWTNNPDYRFDKPLNYFMVGSDTYPDVYLASEIHRQWRTQEDMEANFPEPTYTTQKTPVSKPVSLYHTAQGGTSDNSLYCSNDKTHLSQVGYNAIGLDIAERLVAKLDDTEDVVTYGQFFDVLANDLPSLIMSKGETVTIVAHNAALNNGVFYETSENLSYSALGLTALELGEGTLTMKNAKGEVLDTLAVTVSYDYHFHCICGGHGKGMTGHTCDDTVNWTPWGDQDSEKTTLPTKSGYYYLVEDITPGATSIPAAADVHLCLNGHKIDSGDKRTFMISGNLSVTDCGKQADWGTITSSFMEPYGGVFYQNSGASVVNIFGGNWKATGTNCWGGVGLVSATANIYGGNFYGTKVVRTYVNATQGTRDGRGGTLYVLSGTLNIYGGTFQGGKAQNQGGNIAMSGGALNIYGGTITGGTVDSTLGTVTGGGVTAGGNIAILGGTFNMTGGAVAHGTATGTQGGNIYISTGTHTVAGTVVDGSALEGGNIYVNGGTVTLKGTVSRGKATSGGNVYGFGGTVNVAGANITDGKAANGGSIYVNATMSIATGTVSGGIAETGNGGNIYISTTGTLNMTGGTVTGGIVNATSGLGGNIYVAGEGSAKKGKLVLVGGTISEGQAYCGGNLDVDGEATISGGTITGGTANNGGNLYVGYKTENKIPYATVTMSGGVMEKGVSPNVGGNAQVMGNMTMTGGVIRDGVATSAGGNIRIFRPGVFTLDGGTIENGVSTDSSGGNINISGNVPTTAQSNYGTLIVKSGIISGGKAEKGSGGNIYVQHYGVVQMEGGTITGGSANYGGNIAFYPTAVSDTGVARDSSLTMTGGTISDGTATQEGGNIYMATSADLPSRVAVEISGGTISGGTAKTGAAILNRNCGDVTVSGGTVLTDAEGIRITKTAASTVAPTLVIQDEARLDGNGVNVYVDKAADTEECKVSVSFANLSDEFIRVAASSVGAVATCDEASSTKIISAQEDKKVTYAEGVVSLEEGQSTSGNVAVYNGGKLFGSYETVKEAAQVAIQGGENYIVKLLADTEETAVIEGDLWLDLNGFTLSGISVTGTVYGMDSATNGYEADGAGKLVLNEGKVAVHVRTTAAQTGAVRRYLAIEEADGYSFHRFYFGITHISMEPETAGIGYRATFAGSQKVKDQLNVDQGYGLIASVDGVPEAITDGVVAGFAAADFAQEGDTVSKRVLIQNIFGGDVSDEELAQRGETVIYAVSFLQTKDGEVILSSDQAHSLKSMIEAIDAGFKSYNPENREKLSGFYKTYENAMEGWTLPNLHHTGTKFGEATALTANQFIALLDANKVSATSSGRYLPSGDYYLKENVDIGNRSIVIKGGASVTLCLNGKTLSGSNRIFAIYGDLNLHDCCTNADKEAMHGKVVSSSTADYAHVFYAFYGATFNLYGGDLTTTTGATQAAIGIVSHDGSDKTLPAAVMKMYGGRIYSGKVTAAGGALGVFNNAEFYMYGGEIYDNHSTTNGGAINMTSGVLELQGGVIRDNTAGENGGNLYLKGKNFTIGEGTVISGGEAKKGGNVYMEETTNTHVIDGATISGGSAQWGGNIYIAGGMTTEIRNATVEGGSAHYDGGNLYIYNTGTHLIQDSLFKGGVGGNGGNLYLYNDNSYLKDSMTVTLDSTTVTGGEAPGYIGSHFGNKVGGCGGGIYVWNVDLTLTGKVDITGNIGSDMHVAPATQVKVRELDENATIGVSMTDVGTFLADDSNKSCFFSNSDTREINVVGGKLKLVDKTPAVINTPSTFSAGWARVDITPQSPVYLDGMGLGDKARDGQKVIHPMYASIIAVADETGIENAVVFVTVDVLYVQKPLWETVAAAIGEQTGLPKENILMMASHTHYGPEGDNPHSDNRNHVEYFCTQITNGVIAALQDLKPATAEAGKTTMEGMNFLRRFVIQREDGRIENTTTIRGDRTGTFLDYEDEKDASLQAIRFVREDMDILMINWQSHIFSADAGNYVDPCSTYDMRNYVEGTNGVTSLFQKKTMCAFVQGAAGNSARTSPYEQHVYTSRADYGKRLVEGAIQALANGGAVETGTPKVLYNALDADARGWFKTSVSADQRRTVDLFCVSIGDMAFATAPYEMFCTQGLQLKRYVEENDLFDILFVCGITNGEFNYMPSYRAIMLDQGNTEGEDYEVDVCKFIPGTSENFITEHAKMLVELSGKENVPEADFLADAIEDWKNYKYNPDNL